MQSLPIETVIYDLRQALQRTGAAVLQAPPGAGKTTYVPIALLDAQWLVGQRIVMLEPRRLAARAAARYMAYGLGESVGKTVGYRTRMDTKVSASTRIEVVTEGVLTRWLQRDPTLEGIGLVIFDEFHERNLNADLGLALCLDVRSALREDLRLLVMSATLEGEPVARLLGGAPTITSEGRSFPVAVRYTPPKKNQSIAYALVHVIMKALTEDQGSILVFLPGAREIRRIQEVLTAQSLGPNIILAPLFGVLPREQQDKAILPAPAGKRKIVLATSIAETSLTIEGIRIVVDAGQMRVSRFEPRNGMSRLQTVKVTQASAEQRCGRAGRLEAGVCYRLWERHAHLANFNTAEILEADLAPLVLELAQWGVTNPGQLLWLDAPPSGGIAQAREMLTALDALDQRGRITAHGKEMSALALHPRLAHMVLKAKALGLGGLGCTLAALLSERDILRADYGSSDVDISSRLDVLERYKRTRSAVSHEAGLGACQRVCSLAEALQRQLKVPPLQYEDLQQVGNVLAFAYPDRIGQKRGSGRGRFLLSNGSGAVISTSDSLACAEYIVVAQLDAGHREARVFVAAAVSLDQLIFQFAPQMDERTCIAWDSKQEIVLSRRQRTLGALVLDDKPLDFPDPDQVTGALIKGIRQFGLDVLPWDKPSRRVQSRMLFMRSVSADTEIEDHSARSWPDVSNQWLEDNLDSWLAPYLTGFSRREQLKQLNLESILRGMLSWPQQQTLDKQTPTHFVVPSGSRIPIDYSAQDGPVLAVRIQELFGLGETPRIANGRITLMLHLLSPAGRPMQVTRDLASFWANTYTDVKKDLKGRYPKHYWPDDPLEAQPTRGA